jgi:hypothetical protein
MENDSRFWTSPKRKTLRFLVGSAVLSIGTPAVVSMMQPGARFYLLQPMIFAGQAIPSLVAAALWLPSRSARGSRVALVLSRLLFVASLLFYIPVVTGILPTGGDMIGLGYFLVAAASLVLVVAVTAIAFSVSWLRERRAIAR